MTSGTELSVVPTPSEMPRPRGKSPPKNTTLPKVISPETALDPNIPPEVLACLGHMHCMGQAVCALCIHLVPITVMRRTKARERPLQGNPLIACSPVVNPGGVLSIAYFSQGTRACLNVDV